MVLKRDEFVDISLGRNEETMDGLGLSCSGFYLSGKTFDCFEEAVHVPSLRSEEHTSELQSLMRISYAVFCLKKTTKIAGQHSRSRRLSRTLAHVQPEYNDMT